MKIASILNTATPNSPDLTFRFSDSVDQYLVGATQFYYTFGDKDRKITTIKLGMSPSNVGQDVNLHVTMELNDDKGHDISSSSFVDVSCLAALGQNTNNNVQFNSDLSFPSGSSSTAIGLQNITYTNAPVLEGFNLAYDSDHPIKKIQSTLSASVQQSISATISGTADMNDNSSNSATTKTLEAGYLGTYHQDNACGLVAVEKSYNVGAGTQEVDLSEYLGDKNINEVAIFIKSFDLAFSKDYHMNSITIGARGISVYQQSIRFTPQINMLNDDEDHEATGNLTLIIVGTCDLD